MESNLKPCPFCGCKDIRKLVKRSRADIWCNECGVNMECRRNLVITCDQTETEKGGFECLD